MDPRNFFSGVKRRNLCKVAVACVIGAMLAAAAASAHEIQIAGNVLRPDRAAEIVGSH